MSSTEQAAAHDDLLQRVLALPGSACDSVVLESACLSRGMNTLRVSNIIVLGFSASEPKPVAFRGSASLATSQYAYQVTNDRELRHLKLKGSGIPVPEARSFKARDLKALAAGARELGFPLLAKPLAKHGREQWDSAARDEDELLESVAGLSREVLTRGKPRTHGRVLLERFAGTTGSSVLVVDGEVAGAVSRGARPEASIGAIGFHPDFVELCRRAVSGVPGAGHAEVTIAADDVRSSAARQKHSVVSLSVVPRLLDKRLPLAWSLHIAGAILEATTADKRRPLLTGNTSVTMRLTGINSPRKYADALLGGTDTLSLERRIESMFDDVVTATVAGDPFAIASMSAFALSGTFGRETPQSVECVHRRT